MIYGTTSVTNVDTSSSAFGTGAIAGTRNGFDWRRWRGWRV